MPILKDLDEPYINSLNYSVEQFEKSYQSIQNGFIFDLSTTEITEAIINRLKTYYQTQAKIKTLLDKRYLAPASDYFVESVLFYLKLYLFSQGQKFQAHSERKIKKDKNAIRPDISIWKKDEVIAIIECKTQLGRSRDSWEQQFEDRDLKLKADFPDA